LYFTFSFLLFPFPLSFPFNFSLSTFNYPRCSNRSSTPLCRRCRSCSKPLFSRRPLRLHTAGNTLFSPLPAVSRPRNPLFLGGGNGKYSLPAMHAPPLYEVERGLGGEDFMKRRGLGVR
jgi:hypothetical protein